MFVCRVSIVCCYGDGYWVTFPFTYRCHSNCRYMWSFLVPPLWCQQCLGDKSCDNLVVVMIQAGSSVLEYRVCVFEMMQYTVCCLCSSLHCVSLCAIILEIIFWY